MRSSMKKIVSIVTPLLMVLALGLSACAQAPGGSSGGAPAGASANEIDMAATMFVQTDLTIASGQSVHFVDQQSGTMHVLCVGRDGKCVANANTPRDLAGSGFTIQPGQSHDVRFETAGTYPITCPIHPDMNTTITVR